MGQYYIMHFLREMKTFPARHVLRGGVALIIPHPDENQDPDRRKTLVPKSSLG